MKLSGILLSLLNIVFAVFNIHFYIAGAIAGQAEIIYIFGAIISIIAFYFSSKTIYMSATKKIDNTIDYARLLNVDFGNIPVEVIENSNLRNADLRPMNFQDNGQLENLNINRRNKNEI